MADLHDALPRVLPSPETPAATLTLLFTDVERVTALSARLGDRYVALHEQHRAIIIDAIQARGGTVVDTQGETVFGAFPTAAAAALAAADAQRQLTAHPWPADGRFRVRIGLHTGKPTQTERGLVGIDVHRAARVCTAGHGGQILLSQTARAEIAGLALPGLELRELGEHQLKDMPAPEALYQLVVEGLPAEFPPPRTFGVRSGFPPPRHDLIGRAVALQRCEALLLERGVCLLTITGAGGSGKTALALQLAANVRETFPGGAYFVNLAPLASADLVAESIALALGVTDPGPHGWLRAAQAAIGPRRLLLVLDNFEHVIGAASDVEQLLAACPELVILVTSRDLLHLPAERGFPLPPLELPPLDAPSAEQLLAAPAVALFVARVQDVRPGYLPAPRDAPVLAEICRRLDGLPLAIELAAARVRVLPPAALLQRLDKRLPLLTGGARDLPARQQTLRGAIAWSYELLTPDEQQLVRLMSVFRGCTLDDLQRVCRGEGAWRDTATTSCEEYDGPGCLLPIALEPALHSLVDKSLVQVEQRPDRPRYTMLETIREFALEQLAAAGEADETAARHLACFVGLSEEAEPHLFGPEQAVWLDRLGHERENLRAAEAWAARQGDVESVVRLSAPLLRFWQSRASAAEARERLDAILKLAPVAPQTAATMTALHLAAIVARSLGDFPSTQALLEQSLAIARQLRHQDGIAAALSELSKLAGYRGEYALAEQLGEESLALVEQTGSLVPLAETLREVGMIHYLQGHLTRAADYFERALAAAREIGDLRTIANVAFSRGLVHHVQGERDDARRLYHECLSTDRAQGHRGSEGSVLNNLGHLALLDGDLDGARALLHESLRASREAGDRRRIAFTLSAVAGLMATRHDHELAIQLDASAKAALIEIGATLAPSMRAYYEDHLALAAAALGPERTEAARSHGRATPLDTSYVTALGWLAETRPRAEAAEAVLAGGARPCHDG